MAETQGHLDTCHGSYSLEKKDLERQPREPAVNTAHTLQPVQAASHRAWLQGRHFPGNCIIGRFTFYSDLRSLFHFECELLMITLRMMTFDTLTSIFPPRMELCMAF